MKFTIGSIMTIKLNSGEELVAKITTAEEGSDFILVENPMSVAPGPQGVGLIHSMFTSNFDVPVTINKSAIAMFVIADDKVVSKYTEAVTGIAIPSKKLLVG